MSWVQRHGKKWRIIFKNRHGHEQKLTTQAATKKAAETLAYNKERAEERIRLGTDKPIKPDIPFGEAVKLYLASLPPDYASLDSLVGRLNNRILPYLRSKMSRELTSADVKGMLAGKKAVSLKERDLRPNSELAPATREQLRVAVSGVLTFLIEDERHFEGLPSPENVAGKVAQISGPKQLPKFLELHEVPLVMDAVHPPRRPEFLFSVATGTRKGEHFGLRREDVQLKRQLAFINFSHDRDTTKGGEGRPVPLPRWLIPILEEHLKSHDSPWVFPNKKGQRQARSVKLHLIMRTALKKAGLVTGYRARCVTRGKRKSCGFDEVRAEPGWPNCACGMRLSVQGIPRKIVFHGLRHTFGTWALAQGGNIRHVQAAMGHKNLRTTDIYAKVLAGHLVEMSDRMDLGLGRLLGGDKGLPVPPATPMGPVKLSQPLEMTPEDFN